MFSELIDRAIARSMRPDRAVDITAYANHTIRELTGRGNYFARSMVEDTVTVTGDPYIFTRPNRVQRWRTVYYVDTGIWPAFVMPGKRQGDLDAFYYFGPDYVVFQGCGPNGSKVDYAYYQWLQRLNYYAVADRPAVYDMDSETWTYATAYSSTPELQAAARALVSNWVLLDYWDLVLEGTLAKIFKLVGDINRSSVHYSTYESQYKTVFLGNEVYITMEA